MQRWCTEKQKKTGQRASLTLVSCCETICCETKAGTGHLGSKVKLEVEGQWEVRSWKWEWNCQLLHLFSFRQPDLPRLQYPSQELTGSGMREEGTDLELLGDHVFR